MLFGTAALILVLSVYNGFESLVVDLFDTFRADLVITAKEGKHFESSQKLMRLVKNEKDIKALSFVLEENALFDYDGRQYFAKLKGVDENYTQVNPIDSSMYDGDFDLNSASKNAVLGLGVAKSLNLHIYDAFGKLRVFMPKSDGKINPANPMSAVNIQYLKAVGLFSLEREFDSKYVFVPLAFAQDLLGKDGKVSAVEIVLHPHAKMDKVKSALKNKLDGNKYAIKNKFEQDSTIYQVMKIEKWVAFLILTFILLIAAFNIIGSLSMMVIDKQKDISILQAMGASKSLIYKVFLYLGFLLSFSGAILGFVLAIIVGFLQHRFELIPINANGNFLIDALPVEFRINDFIIIFLTVLIIGIFASYFPARKASNSILNLKA